MINNDTAKSTYTVTDGVTEYPIVVQYTTKPDGTPNLYVCTGDLYGDNVELEYGTGYNLSADGLSIVLLSAVEDGTTLNIAVDEQFIQDSDYVIGRIDPEQIERDFDKSVLRDLELRDSINANDDDIADLQSDIADLQADVAGKVSKSGDTMTGALNFTNGTDTQDIQLKHYGAGVPGFVIERVANSVGFVFDFAITGGMFPQADNTLRIGTPSKRLARVYTKKISGSSTYGNEIDVPETGGTMALLSDLPSTAADVHALPDTTKYGASLVATIDPSTFVMTLTLKDQDGNALGSSQTIDLPLESVVVSGAYDSATREVVLTLEGGSTIRFSVADLVSGLQTEITAQNMLDADLVDDSTSTNKFVTAAEKTAISTAVQPGDLAVVATSGNYSDLSGTPSLASVATSGLYSDLSGTPSLSTVATSGDYDDLLNKPTIPDTTHMVTDNTAQSISAVKTFTAANPDATTAQTIVANYAVKFGTSGNNDLFSISANTNTSTLSIVGDNASNIIDIAASGAVLNHFQVTSSDVTFGGKSLINPGVMTGADGVNAGAAGLVPVPAATDNVNFLCGDGTWKAAGGGLPSQTGNAGKFLTTDGTDASWSDKPLVNVATGSNSITIKGVVSTASDTINIGRNSSVNNKTYAIAIGNNAQAKDYNAIAIGRDTEATYSSSIALGNGAKMWGSGVGVAVGIEAGNYPNATAKCCTCIGAYAKASAPYAIQINASDTTQTNSEQGTLAVALRHNNTGVNYKLLDSDGTVPTARLTKVNTTVTLAAANWAGGSQTVSVTGMTATGIVFVNPDPSDQADYTSAGILCTAQAAGTLTFTCDTTPSNDIDVVVIMM